MFHVPLEMLHERFRQARDLAALLLLATEAVQANPTGTGAIADFEKCLQALAALAAESPEAQRARLEARRRVQEMSNQLSSMAQQLGYVQTWFASVLPETGG